MWLDVASFVVIVVVHVMAIVVALMISVMRIVTMVSLATALVIDVHRLPIVAAVMNSTPIHSMVMGILTMVSLSTMMPSVMVLMFTMCISLGRWFIANINAYLLVRILTSNFLAPVSTLPRGGAEFFKGRN